MRKLVILALCLTMLETAADQRRDTLGAFVGEWQMELMADSDTFGERGGPGTGHMSCGWGLMQAWVDCTLDSNYEGLGRYALKIVLYPHGKDGYGAFVTNSFGGGRLYHGMRQGVDTLIYRDAWVDPQRKWEHQRTTYKFVNANEISFVIDVSNDNALFRPHSSGIYRRQ